MSGVRMRSLSVLSLALVGAYASAQHVEAGDAGNLPATAQSAGLNSIIQGTINALGDSDMFRISINNPAAFSAVVVGSATNELGDSMLYLFNLDGTGIAANDDIDTDNDNFYSHFTAGNALYSGLAPGEYLIAISGFFDMPKQREPGEDPLLDYVFDPGLGEAIIGPNAGAGPVISWDGTRWGFNQGGYEIRMTGVGPVPEPATLAVLGIGAAALLRRRRK